MTSSTRTGAMRRVGPSTGATLVIAAAAVAGGAAPAHADEQVRVRSGDTVSAIAARTGSSVRAIADANRLADVHRIREGQVLTVPTGAPSAPRAAAAAPAAPPAPAATAYTVVTGDTVGAIAARTGSSVAAIVAANGLDSRAFIRAGQTLQIPGAGAAAAPAPAVAAAAVSTATTSVTVRRGDTVGAIAARTGTTVAAVVAANGLDARAFIREGQVLTVPVAAAATPAAPAPASVGNTFAGRTYADDVVAAANANKAALVRAGVPSKADMQAKVAATARAMGVDPALAQAVAFQESGFNHTAVSPANAIGTMQVIPSSGEWASQLVGRPLDLLHPDDNVVAGVAILRSLVRTSADLPSAIAGYYQGAASVRKNGMYADTRRYVASVQTLMTRFG